jgi:hypothetical protein
MATGVPWERYRTPPTGRLTVTGPVTSGFAGAGVKEPAKNPRDDQKRREGSGDGGRWGFDRGRVVRAVARVRGGGDTNQTAEVGSS